MHSRNEKSRSSDYVLPRKPGERDAWTNEAARQGRVGSQQLLQVAEVSPPADVSDALGLDHGEHVVVRRRLVLADDIPVELTDSYYPLSIARGTVLAEHRKIRGGAVSALAELGHAPRFVSESVHARMASAAERDLLGIAAERAVLVVLRVARDNERRPVEATVMVIADGRHLQYEVAT